MAGLEKKTWSNGESLPQELVSMYYFYDVISKELIYKVCSTVVKGILKKFHKHKDCTKEVVGI